MENSVCQICGGCLLRGEGEAAYRLNKFGNFKKTIAKVKDAAPIFDAPFFVADGRRRRADMEFVLEKNELKLGFYEKATHRLVNVENCPMLCCRLNKVLPHLHSFLEAFSRIPLFIKNKKKKPETVYLSKGAAILLDADNGVSVLLDLAAEPGLEHRMLAAEFVNETADLLRLSWRVGNKAPETVAQKAAPELLIGNRRVLVEDGVFLQASKDSESAMIETVLRYMGDASGKVADLFCGIGTFSLPISQDKRRTVVAADISGASLETLKKTIDLNQICNINIVNRNLFKYPFDTVDLKGVKTVVIDPPRAGAHAQCREIAALLPEDKPETIIFVSCNPETFVYDASVLISAGYEFRRVTFIDQFVYSVHEELVALFTFNPYK